jgi:transposase
MVLGKVGSEEFALLLTNSPHADALAFAEILRTKIAERPVEWRGSKTTITMSVGFATSPFSPGEVSPPLARADAALYRAKRKGRGNGTSSAAIVSLLSNHVPLRRHRCATVVVLRTATRGEASMEEVSIIGLDLAKNVFQAHGARADGSTSFRKKISRAKVLSFFASVPKRVVAMEACASSHHWARQIGALGHEVRLIAPIYVKPFVKRNKNDAADAEAIAEAASRPTMRFVAVKSAEKQASGMAFKTRDLLVRQRTQTINALRGHMAEYGVVAPNGPVHIERLAEALQDSGSGLPAAVVALSQILLAHIGALTEQIGLLDRELRERARHDQTAKRLMTIPGVGVICAVAMEALAPAPEGFAKGRDFAAWLGLTPRQNSSGARRA